MECGSVQERAPPRSRLHALGVDQARHHDRERKWVLVFVRIANDEFDLNNVREPLALTPEGGGCSNCGRIDAVPKSRIERMFGHGDPERALRGEPDAAGQPPRNIAQSDVLALAREQRRKVDARAALALDICCSHLISLANPQRSCYPPVMTKPFSGATAIKPRRETKASRARAAKFNKAILDHARGLGGVDLDEHWRPAIRLETAWGPLRITPLDTWLACRFETEEGTKRACAAFAGLRWVNPFSGKYNHHPGLERDEDLESAIATSIAHIDRVPRS